MLDVDTIVSGGRIYTEDENSRTAMSMAIKDGRILAVGTFAEIESDYRAAERVDATGRFVYPGFIDPHSHFLYYGCEAGQVDLSGTLSWEETVARLAERAEPGAGGWILGRAWEQTLWKDKSFPSNELLDEAFPDVPAMAIRVDGHSMIVNSTALRLAEIDAFTRLPGGEIALRDGKPTGLLLDQAADKVRAARPAFSHKEKAAALIRAQADCYAVGLTSVSDACIEAEDVGLMDELQKEGSLAIFVYAMLFAHEKNFERYVSKGPYVTEGLSVRSIKLFADGTLGSRGALLMEPYSDAPGRVGLRVDPMERFDEVCDLALRSGYQVNTHSIGDRSTRETLDVYQRYLKPGNDLRWRLEHLQVVQPSDLKRFRKYRVIPSIQASHATSDMRWAEDRLGPGRLKHAYAFKDLLEQNGWLANGSDFPVEGINPLLSFYAAVSRKDRKGEPKGGFQLENALTRRQALRAMTIWAARACFEEGRRGSLESGKTADFVILDRDILEVREADILSARVEATYRDGRRVYPR